MSNAIPPLLSSSPPPILEEDADADDEFGDFTTAANLYGCDVSDQKICVDTLEPAIPPSPDDTRTLEINISAKESFSEPPRKDYQDRRKCEGESQEAVDIFVKNNYNSLQYIKEMESDILKSEEEQTNGTEDGDDNETNDDAVAKNENFKKINADTINSKEASPEEAFDDYANFTDTPNDLDRSANKLQENVNVEEFEQDDFADFQSSQWNDGGVDDNEDEWADFGDYGDFKSIGQEEMAQDFTTFEEAEDSSNDALLDKLFPEEDCPIELIPNETVDFLSNNEILKELLDVTNSNALQFRWTNSCSQTFLLRAINVDFRNMFYGPRWNETMPRYAAALSFTPLEPVKSQIAPKSSILTEPKHVLLVKDSSIGEKIDEATNDISNENAPGKIETDTLNVPSNGPTFPGDNDSVKSLQLTDLVATEDDFDSFASFQSAKSTDTVAVWAGNMVPLRETHISNVHDNTQEPGWLKPTILTPTFERNGADAEQAVKKIETQEFSAFSASSSSSSSSSTYIVEPLKPIVMNTNSTSNSTAINWPEPGVTDDELVRLELSYKPPLSTCPNATNLQQVEDEDDWSDFVSGVPKPIKSVSNSRTATPELPLCIPRLDAIRRPKNTVPLITAQGIVQSTISSAVPFHNPIVRSPSRQVPKPSTASTVSDQYVHHVNGFSVSSSQDDEWSDFVSSENGGGGGSSSSWFPEPSFTPKRSQLPNSTITSLPDLEFIAPKNVSWKK